MVSDQNTKLKNILTKSNTNISRDIPINVGAEQSLLGAILSNNLALEKVEDFLEPKHFSSKINSVIFGTLMRLISNNQIADLTTIKVFLENNEVKTPLPKKISIDVPNNHLKYAITWYAISVSIVFYYLYFRRKK